MSASATKNRNTMHDQTDRNTVTTFIYVIVLRKIQFKIK